MALLSIDVGIKNLAMCLMDTQTRQIRQWDVSGVPPQHTDGLFLSMKHHLDTRTWCCDAQTVVIEKQPDKNRGIKSVEHFLHAYFLCHDKDVVIWDARHKVPDVVGPGRARYLERKKASIDRCRSFLQATQPQWLPVFDRHKKRDDLADTCMQALSYLDRVPTVSEAPKKQKPRRPTQNQTLTRYSKANLAWLFTQGEHKTKRFEKDLARYYRSVDELVNDFCLGPK